MNERDRICYKAQIESVRELAWRKGTVEMSNDGKMLESDHALRFFLLIANSLFLLILQLSTKPKSKSAFNTKMWPLRFSQTQSHVTS